MSRERPQITIGLAVLALSVLLALAAEIFILAVYAPDRVAAQGERASAVPEFGSGIPISQTFQATANGLEAVRLLVHAGQATEIPVDWALAEQLGAGWMTVTSGDRRLTLAAGAHWQVVPLPRIATSAGRTYRFTLRRTAAATGSQDVALAAWLDNPLRNGFLSVGGQDRWGDLRFEARAKGDTIAGRFQVDVIYRLRPPFNGMWTWIALVVGLNVLLVMFAAGFVHGDAANGAGLRVLPRLPSLVLTILLITATVTTIAVAGRSDTKIDLVEEMYRAHWTSVPPLHWGLDLRDTTIGAETLRAIFAHPSSRITWTLALPPGAHLRTSLGIDPGAWPMDLGDGVQFRVTVQSEAGSSEVFSQHVDPRHVAGDQRWIPVDVDLSRFGGQTVALTLSTDPSPPGQPPNPFYDWALWGKPRITSSR